MSDKVLVDTNLWIYFYVKDPPEKAEMVAEIINTRTLSLVVSTQILGELYHVLTRENIFSKLDAQAIVLDLSNIFSILAIDT